MDKNTPRNHETDDFAKMFVAGLNIHGAPRFTFVITAAHVMASTIGINRPSGSAVDVICSDAKLGDTFKILLCIEKTADGSFAANINGRSEEGLSLVQSDTEQSIASSKKRLGPYAEYLDAISRRLPAGPLPPDRT